MVKIIETLNYIYTGDVSKSISTIVVVLAIVIGVIYAIIGKTNDMYSNRSSVEKSKLNSYYLLTLLIPVVVILVYHIVAILVSPMIRAEKINIRIYASQPSNIVLVDDKIISIDVEDSITNVSGKITVPRLNTSDISQDLGMAQTQIDVECYAVMPQDKDMTARDGFKEDIQNYNSSILLNNDLSIVKIIKIRYGKDVKVRLQ